MSLTIRANFDNQSMPTIAAEGRQSVDARKLDLGKMNPIDAKRNSARKQAMKLIGDAWERDSKAYAGIQEMKDSKAAKVEEYLDLKGKINDLQNQKEHWREEYGVAADSEEQKDLELLEKYQDNKSGAAYDSFSDEEKARLKELAQMPLTDYQKKVLEINAVKDSLDIELQKKENSIIAMSASITTAEIDMEKNQDMIKSQDAAEKLLDAASKDIVGMLVDEAKEHLDSVDEETEKKAEKLKEQTEEREERLEKAKERREEQEEIIHDQIEVERLEADNNIQEQSVDHLAEAQHVIEKMMNDNHMVNEDLKGIEIDFKF